MRRALSLATLLCLLSGCAASIEFDGEFVSNGVTGKSWQTPYFVDAPIYQPGAQSRSELVKDFDVALFGTKAQVVASLWDPLTTSTYRGYARLYEDAVGWSPFGADFGQIATDGTNSLTSVTVSVDPDGLFMANLFTAAPTLRSASAGYVADDGWELTATTTVHLNVPAGPGSAVSAMDADGNGYVFFADAAAVWQSTWTEGSGNGLAAGLNPVYAGAIQAASSLTARFDGVGQVCATYEDATGSLLANCENVTGAGPFTFGSPDTISASGAETVAGHDTATDGEGGIMAVFYRGSGTDFHVYSSLATNGVWPTAITQIDDQSDDFGAPWPTASGSYFIAGARPGVAYVGDGRYLAVWVGVDVVASPPATQLYSNLYDPAAGGWQGAAAIDDTEDSFSTTEGKPHAQSLTVFGNADGNAGYALNKIHTSDNIGGTNTGSTPAVYPEDAQVRMLEVNRWHEDDGWVGAKTFTDFACFNEFDATYPWLAKAGSGADADCTHRPVGVIFPSGNALVFFQAQDGFSSGSVPGNRRVGVVAFE